MNIRGLLFGLLLLIVGIVGTGLVIRFAVHSFEEQEPYHVHADIALFLNGQRFDLSQSKYMEIAPCNAGETHEEDESLLDRVHLHDGNGNVVHVHAPNITYAQFFESLNMHLTESGFTDDEGHNYIEDQDHSFHFYRNGEPTADLPSQTIQDLDRVLISFDARQVSNERILTQMGQLTSDACFYSGQCTTRNLPSTETCARHPEPSPLLKLLDINL